MASTLLDRAKSCFCRDFGSSEFLSFYRAPRARILRRILQELRAPLVSQSPLGFRGHLPLAYSRVIGFLRCVGLLNAAIWFGAGIHFTFFAGAAAFSPEMKDLIGANNYPYFSGAIAQILITRYFRLQIICAIIAFYSSVGGSTLPGRLPTESDGSDLSLLVLLLTFVGPYWLQPRLSTLHKLKYAVNVSPQVREAAAASCRTWHGAVQVINLAMLIGPLHKLKYARSM